MQETRSINCCGCGGGLPSTQTNTVKCEYCGSYNRILEDGKTIKYNPAVKMPNKMSKSTMIAIGLAGVIMPSLIRYTALKAIKK